MSREDRERFLRWVIFASDSELRQHLVKEGKAAAEKDIQSMRNWARYALKWCERDRQRRERGHGWSYHYLHEEFRKSVLKCRERLRTKKVAEFSRFVRCRLQGPQS